MIRYRVLHENVFDYTDLVVNSHNEARLQPRTTASQRLEGLELRIEPTPDTVRWHDDYFGNGVVFFSLLEPHQRLVLRTESVVAIEPLPAFDPARSPAFERVRERAQSAADDEALAAFEFVFDSTFVKTSVELAEYARPSFPPGTPLAAGVLDLCHRIHADFRYDPEATTLETPIDEVLQARHGVCQDFAHVMIGALRSIGLPARYVSGYLRTRRHDDPKPPPAPAPSAPQRGRSAPASAETAAPGASGASGASGEGELVGSEASHAWVSCWCPELGWIEVDPTNDLVPSDRHVTLGWGRDYDDVSPVKGVTLGGGSHSVAVSVEVRPVSEAG